MKKMLCALLALVLALSMAACGGASAPDTSTEGSQAAAEPSTLVYGSTDYTRINPAMDEHCEINVLMFDGLLDHDGDNNLIP